MPALRQSCVYIMSNVNCSVFYIGVTSNLEVRVWQHRNVTKDGFTKRYNLKRLVWFEIFSDISNAIAREKKLKGWRREKKIALIAASNPQWHDLAADWFWSAVAAEGSGPNFVPTHPSEAPSC